MRLLTALITTLCILTSPLTPARTPPTPQINNLEDLSTAIDRVLTQTNTPGAAVALIQPDGQLWLHTSGKADLKAGTPVTADTQFRVGSISKILVAASVMKLVELRKVSLDARLAEVAPEIEFDNPWEQRNPIRLVHLLNHSTGWDAPHFAELVSEGGKPTTIGAALAKHPHSRTSRWVPGSRTAYNNTGPLVAAYIVEKVSGIPYEEFVQQEFFEPLGMHSSGYFYSDHYRNNAATLYRAGQPLPYWHLNNRAAGGMHSSARDMAQLVRFLLQRGQISGRHLLGESSFEALERVQGTLPAANGLQLSWGLGMNLFHHNGAVFHGHEGSLPGANSMLAYQPELGAAYVVMTNSGGPAMAQIHRLMADYVTADYSATAVAADRALTEEDFALSGFYRVVSPMSELTAAFSRLVPWSLEVNARQATIRPAVGAQQRTLIPGPGSAFRQETSGRIALVRVSDPIEGDVLHYGPQTLAKTSLVEAYAPLLIAVLWLVCALVAVAFSFIWLPRYLSGKISRGPSLAIRVWPLLSVLSVLAVLFAVKIMFGSATPFALAGRPSVPSLAVFLGTCAFFMLTLWSLRVWWRYRDYKMNRFVKYHSTLLVLLNFLVGLYLLGYGLIGVRLWA